MVGEDPRLPQTYCYCGAGFYQGIWEKVLDEPVQVEVLESVMTGGDVCQIAVELPQSVSLNPKKHE
jgi:predicted hydrocarbon binding protein